MSLLGSGNLYRDTMNAEARQMSRDAARLTRASRTRIADTKVLDMKLRNGYNIVSVLEGRRHAPRSLGDQIGPASHSGGRGAWRVPDPRDRAIPFKENLRHRHTTARLYFVCCLQARSPYRQASALFADSRLYVHERSCILSKGAASPIRRGPLTHCTI